MEPRPGEKEEKIGALGAGGDLCDELVQDLTRSSQVPGREVTLSACRPAAAKRHTRVVRGGARRKLRELGGHASRPPGGGLPCRLLQGRGDFVVGAAGD
jgi:hypothetical protein